MLVLSLQAFATELVKLALEIQDPDIRALKAARTGQEYLVGGRLQSNASDDTNFQPKLAFRMNSTSSMSINPMLGQQPVQQQPQQPVPGAYSAAKDWGMSTVKGVATGASLMGLGHALYKAVPDAAGGLKEFRPSLGAMRTGALIGGGLAVGDKLLSRHLRKKQEAQMAQRTMAKVAMMGSSTFSPGRAERASNQVGRFESKTIHHPDVKNAAGLIGRKGCLPKV